MNKQQNMRSKQSHLFQTVSATAIKLQYQPKTAAASETEKERKERLKKRNDRDLERRVQ